MAFDFVNIPGFQGLYSRADGEDIPLGAARHCDGLDPSLPTKWQGLEQDTEHIATNVDGEGFIPLRAGDKVIYYRSGGGDIRKITDPDGTPTSALLGAAAGSYDGGGASDAVGCRLGLGLSNDAKWTDGTQVVGASLLPPAVPGTFDISIASGTGNDQDSFERPFKKETGYIWGMSLVYDGFQESPLVTGTDQPFTDATDVPTQFFDQYTLTITKPAVRPNARVTHVNIYRADAGIKREVRDMIGVPQPIPNYPGHTYTIPGDREIVTLDPESTGPFTLVAVLKWDDAGWVANTTYTLVDDYKIGAEFRLRTGFSQTLKTMDLQYKLSMRVGDYHVIAGLHVVGETDPEGEYLVAFSKGRRFDTYDWNKDWKALPTTITAMAFYQGRLWCFNKGVSYIMAGPPIMSDPITVEGIGASAQKSVVVTKFGMLIANDQNIFFHDGSRFTPIGDPVLINDHTAVAGYLSKDSSAPVCTYIPHKNLFCVFYKASGNIHCLAFYPPLARWTHIDLGVETGTLGGAFVTVGGKCMLAVGTRLLELFVSGNTTRAWSYVGKWITAEGRRQIVMKARVITSNAPVLKYAEDGGGLVTPSWAAEPGGDAYLTTVNSSPTSLPADHVWAACYRFHHEITHTVGKTMDAITFQRRILHV